MRRLLLALCLLLVLVRPVAAQIAHDASPAGGGFAGSTTTLTYAHTTTGSDRFLFVCGYTSDGTLTATYNGTAMTAINAMTIGNGQLRLFGLANPSSGANNIVLTSSNSASIFGWSSSYTGASQGAVDTTSSTQDDADGNTTATFTLAVSGSDSWTYLCIYDADYQTVTAGTGSTLRVTNGTWGGFKGLDSGGTTSGTASMSVTSASGPTHIYGVMGRVTVPGGGGATCKGHLLLLGVGGC